MKKKSASSRRARRRGSNAKPTKAHAGKLERQLAALTQLSDEEIDTSDIAEVTDWSKAVVGRFYRPLKEPVTLRLDADVLAWLKSEGPGYQTRVNALLREAMAEHGAKPSHANHRR
jgi:uncharacterized protein (DUF4415 family)